MFRSCSTLEATVGSWGGALGFSPLRVGWRSVGIIWGGTRWTTIRKSPSLAPLRPAIAFDESLSTT